MENQETFRTPTKELARMQVVHLGKITFKLQFVVLAIMIACVVSFIIPAIYYIILFAISLFTFFTIFIAYPEFSSLWSGGEFLLEVATALSKSWKYTVPIALVLSAITIACLCLDKYKKNTSKIIGSIVIAVLAIAVLIFSLISKGGV